MNTIQINQTLSRNPVTCRAYLGCFAADHIPTVASLYPHCMVFNTDPAGMKGAHWVCIYSDAPNHVEYYDSLGGWPPVSPHIARYLSNFEHLKYSPWALQSPYAHTCGRHVIFFLFNRCAGVPFERIIKFLIQSKRPDSQVSEFIRKHIFGSNIYK